MIVMAAGRKWVREGKTKVREAGERWYHNQAGGNSCFMWEEGKPRLVEIKLLRVGI
jgi:hypothetical protein